MDTTTYDAINDRIQRLELEIGKPNGNEPLLFDLALLQEKLALLYKSNSEFKTLETVFRSVQTSKIPKEFSNPDIPISEKQEQLLVRYPMIREAYNNLIELLSLDIPHFSGEALKALDLTQVSKYETTINELNHNFHLLVVKNMIIFDKYMSLLERENNFWINAERRFNSLKMRLNALEGTSDLDTKY